MSDFAIAAVTATLRSVLQSALQKRGINGVDVTTLPLDKAGNVGQANRLNLFLYHMMPNAAWRNQTIPNRVKRGETGFPPLALNLFYLLTAYGDEQTNESDHLLIGAGLRALHDQAVLLETDIRNATDDPSRLKEAALDRQFEQVKITPEVLSLEEMSKLWTTFQTQYRISAAFQASVVLIESQRQTRSPLPVLKRGEEDRGVDVIPSMPGVLEGVEYRDLRTRLPAFPAAQLGDMITLQGRNLPGSRCRVLFIDPNRKPTINNPDANIVATLAPETGSNDTKIYVLLDPAQPNWVAGPLQIQLQELPQPGAKRPARSNALRFGLAPSLLVGNTFSAVVDDQNGRRQLVLKCQPAISISTGPDATAADPEVSLLLSPIARQASVPPKPLNRKSNSFTPATPVFDVHDVPPGRYRVRIRIETVETLIMKREGATLDFDERQEVQL